jgi:hypothetical protein
MSKKQITIEEMRDTKNHGMKMPAGIKTFLFRKAGERQAKGETGADFGQMSIVTLINEALADVLGFQLPEREQEKQDPSAMIPFAMNLPKQLRVALEKESNRRLQMRASNSSMNAIILESLEKKYGKSEIEKATQGKF